MRIFICLPVLFCSTISFSQRSTFDIIDFLVPPGWTVQDTEGMKVLSVENKQSNSYCVITIFKSRTAGAKIEDDFNSAWNDIIAGAYKGPAKPISIEKQQAEGNWFAMAGSAVLHVQGISVSSLLTVFSGEKRTFSVFTLFNDQGYLSAFDQFLQGLDINKQALSLANNTQETPAKRTEAATAETKNDRLQTFENFIYTLPPGWTRNAGADRLELYPQQLKPHESFSIVLLKGKISTASIQEELANCWVEFARILGGQMLREVSGNNYNTDEISKTDAGWEYIAGHGSMRKGVDYFVHAYIIRAKDRIERVIVFSKEIRLDAMRSNIDPTTHHYPYYVTITDFIFNLRFANFQPAELKKATLKGNEITGVWAGIGFGAGRLRATYAAFFSNGQVFYGNPFPVNGLLNLNTHAEKERSKRNWGTYTFQNGKGTVKMIYGSFPISLEGDKLVLSPIKEKHNFIRLQSVDNATLNGTWMIRGINDQPFFITFRSDGTFTDNGALKVLDHTVYDYYSIADGGGTGSYFMKDHSIVFTYSDGRVLQIAFPGLQFMAGNTSPKELILSFNNDLLIKQ
ncbi:MAG TPA: hypothetical protein VFP97_07820 [Chitinophagaceae bacterium]|nr:hypothetical protein [Chitinophagaceae bacterium]